MRTAKAIAIVTLSLFSLGCAPASEKAPADTGTVAEAPPPELFGECNAKSLDYAVGQKLDAALQDKLRKEAKAGTVRVTAHDGVITMDFSPSRLNIFIDDKRKIVRINCG